MRTWYVVCALVISGVPAGAWAKPPICQTVQSSLDSAASAIRDPRLLVELAPYVGEGTIGPLLARAGTATTADEALWVYLTVGLSRHAAALSKLAATPRSPQAYGRLGVAVARLALGDGALSATVADALYTGEVSVRRRTAEALAMMEQKRPQIMLFDALNDADPQVQLVAGRIHFPRHSRRARRVLLKLLADGTPEVRSNVARLLVSFRYRFSELSPVPEPLRGRALVYAASRNSRGVRALRTQLLSRSPIERRAAFAGLAALAVVSPKILKRLALRPRALHGPLVDAELTMALALMGDAAAVQALAAFEREAAEAASEVLHSFAGAPSPYSQLDADHARGLVRALESWVVRGVVSEETQERLIDSVSRAEPNAGLRLARARLAGPEGAGLNAAVSVLARTGQIGDIEGLLGVANRQLGPVRVEAFRAAAAICRTSY